MYRCEECHFYKNGCDFSESNLPEEELKRIVACAEFFSNDDYDIAMEEAYRIGQKTII